MVKGIRRSVILGLDLGQCRDYSALAVLERAEYAGEFDAGVWAHRRKAEVRVRGAARAPLGTPYPEVVEWVRRTAPVGEKWWLAVDGTGVGRPVVDLFRAARLAGCRLMPVSITGGWSEGEAKGYATVPKRDLMAGVQVLLERRELKIAKGMKWAEALAEELGSMRVRVKEGGTEEMEGERDDLVMALALACWAGRKLYGERLSGECGWCRADGVVVQGQGRIV